MKTRMKVRVEAPALATLLVASWAIPAVAATVCVRPTPAPRCFTSIQAGVNASFAGDVVKVAAGTYYENVVVPGGRNGLAILGAGRSATIVDAGNLADLGITTHTGPAFDINSQGAEVRDLTIRGGQSWGVSDNVGGGVFEELDVLGSFMGIRSNGANGQIMNNTVRDGVLGIAASGAGVVVRNNTVVNCRDVGIDVSGDGAQVISNRVRNTDTGIVGGGVGAIFKGNDIRYSTGAALMVDGDNPIVQSNKVLGVGGLGVVVACSTCSGASIAGNSIVDARDYGLLVLPSGAGATVEKNTLLRTGVALSINGTAATASSNKSTEASMNPFASCFEVYGDAHVLTANMATNCSQAGFFVSGSGSSLSSNKATTALVNGFTVSSGTGNVLTNNKIDDAAQGFAVLAGASSTSLTGNTASKSRVGFCDQGTGTVADSSNHFGSTGACDITR